MQRETLPPPKARTRPSRAETVRLAPLRSRNRTRTNRALVGIAWIRPRATLLALELEDTTLAADTAAAAQCAVGEEAGTFVVTGDAVGSVETKAAHSLVAEETIASVETRDEILASPSTRTATACPRLGLMRLHSAVPTLALPPPRGSSRRSVRPGCKRSTTLTSRSTSARLASKSHQATTRASSHRRASSSCLRRCNTRRSQVRTMRTAVSASHYRHRQQWATLLRHPLHPPLRPPTGIRKTRAAPETTGTAVRLQLLTALRSGSAVVLSPPHTVKTAKSPHRSSIAAASLSRWPIASSSTRLARKVSTDRPRTILTCLVMVEGLRLEQQAARRLLHTPHKPHRLTSSSVGTRGLRTWVPVRRHTRRRTTRTRGTTTRRPSSSTCSRQSEGVAHRQTSLTTREALAAVAEGSPPSSSGSRSTSSNSHTSSSRRSRLGISRQARAIRAGRGTAVAEAVVAGEAGRVNSGGDVPLPMLGMC